MKSRIVLVVSVCLVVLGLVFGVAAGVMAVQTSAFLSSAEPVAGVVTALDEQRVSSSSNDNPRRDRYTYRPVVVFEVDGAEHTFTGRAGSNPPRYDVGEQVDVLYNPDDPSDARLAAGFAYLMEVIFGLAALVLLVVGSVLIAVRSRAAARGRLPRTGERATGTVTRVVVRHDAGQPARAVIEPRAPVRGAAPPASMAGGAAPPAMDERSVYGRPLTELVARYGRVWLWIVLAVVLAMLGFGAVVLLLLMSDDDGRSGASPEVIDCAEALGAADLEALPQGAEPVCAEGGFQDPFVTIDFAAPESDVGAWLRSELPATELQHGDACFESDGCLQISYGEPDAPESGWTLDIKTVDQGDGTVAVTVGAYSL